MAKSSKPYLSKAEDTVVNGYTCDIPLSTSHVVANTAHMDSSMVAHRRALSPALVHGEHDCVSVQDGPRPQSESLATWCTAERHCRGPAARANSYAPKA